MSAVSLSEKRRREQDFSGWAISMLDGLLLPSGQIPEFWGMPGLIWQSAGSVRGLSKGSLAHSVKVSDGLAGRREMPQDQPG